MRFPYGMWVYGVRDCDLRGTAMGRTWREKRIRSRVAENYTAASIGSRKEDLVERNAAVALKTSVTEIGENTLGDTR